MNYLNLNSEIQTQTEYINSHYNIVNSFDLIFYLGK